MGGETGDMASTVGMMGALRTGNRPNPIVDMMLAMLVPIVIKKILDNASQQSFGEAFVGLRFWSPYYFP